MSILVFFYKIWGVLPVLYLCKKITPYETPHHSERFYREQRLFKREEESPLHPTSFQRAAQPPGCLETGGSPE